MIRVKMACENAEIYKAGAENRGLATQRAIERKTREIKIKRAEQRQAALGDDRWEKRDSQKS